MPTDNSKIRANDRHAECTRRAAAIRATTEGREFLLPYSSALLPFFCSSCGRGTDGHHTGFCPQR